MRLPLQAHVFSTYKTYIYRNSIEIGREREKIAYDLVWFQFHDEKKKTTEKYDKKDERRKKSVRKME